MGTSLFGLTPAATYPSLIKFGDNSAISGTLRALSDGLGTDLPIQVSTAGVNFTGTASIGGTAIVTNASGVSGAIQFSNGSAFASDASNLFWDDTNNRLGIGTNAPTTSLQIDYASSTLNGILINQTGGTNNFSNIGFANGGTIKATLGVNLNSGEVRLSAFPGGYFPTIYSNGSEALRIDTSQNVNIGATALGARLGIKGSGSTSATTALLVQNSAGNNLLKIGDGARIDVLGTIGQIDFSSYYQLFSTGNLSTVGCWKSQQAFSVDGSRLCVNVASTSHSASASFQVDSTTTGILPPRMTTAEKNAIATPAAGLIVFDNTVNKLFVHNGVGWEQIQSI